MQLCEKHGHVYSIGGYCNECNRENIALVKADHKEKNQKLKTYNKKIQWKKKSGSSSDRTAIRNRLKTKLQSLVSAKFKERFKGTEYWFCWIGGMGRCKFDNSGLYSLHCAHYIAKGTIWQLWDHPYNVFPCCKYHNVDRPQDVAEARGMMVRIYGEEKVLEVEALAQYYRESYGQMKENKTPTELQLQGLIIRNTPLK